MEQALRDQLSQWHEEGKYRKIIRSIQALDEGERDYEAIGLLARALNNIDDYEGAIEQLESVREQGRDDPLWQFRYGYACFYLDRFDESSAAFGRVVELDETDEDAWIMIARSDKARGDREGFERASERVKRMNPLRWRRFFGDQSNKQKSVSKLKSANKPVRIDESGE